MKRERYLEYNYNPLKAIPKTTAWRIKKRKKELDATGEDINVTPYEQLTSDKQGI